MNIKLVALVLLFLLGWAQAYAADGRITISSPANGAGVDATGEQPLSSQHCLPASTTSAWK